MKHIYLFSLLIAALVWSTAGYGQSYQQNRGDYFAKPSADSVKRQLRRLANPNASQQVNPYTSQPVSPQAPKREQPLSGVEVKMLKLYYDTLLEQKEAKLKYEIRDRVNAQRYVKELTAEKDSLITKITLLQDSLRQARQSKLVQSPPVTAYSSPSPTVTYPNTNSSRGSLTYTVEGGYVYSERSAPKSSKAPKRRANSSQRTYYTGPRGGCFYYTGSGRKEYVDRSLCQ